MWTTKHPYQFVGLGKSGHVNGAEETETYLRGRNIRFDSTLFKRNSRMFGHCGESDTNLMNEDGRLIPNDDVEHVRHGLVCAFPWTGSVVDALV